MIFLPIGDYPNPQRTQWITRSLIGLNVAVFLLTYVPMGRPLTQAERQDREIRAVVAEMDEVYGDRLHVTVDNVSRYDVFTYEYGYKPARPEWLDLLVCMFLHGGWLHIFGNMLFLWIYGDNVEARLGPTRYLGCYLLTGAVATWAFAMMNQGSGIPLVGASGAISGVLGFYLIWFPHNRIKIFLWFFYFIQVLHIPAIWVLGFYVVIENLLPILARASGGVAHGAHLGGFIAGAAIALGINVVFGKRPAPRPQVERARKYTRDEWRQVRAREMEAPRESFTAAIGAGRMEDAAYAFARMAREGGAPPEPAAVFTLAHWLYENDFTRDAAAVFRYYIRNYPRGSDLDRVQLGLGILLTRRLGQHTAARQHLLEAIDLADEGSAIADTARAELRRLGG